MKVLCKASYYVSNIDLTNYHAVNKYEIRKITTVDKWYEIFKESSEKYRIFSDLNHEVWIEKNYFYTQQELRKRKLYNLQKNDKI